MLRATFQLGPGIGPGREHRLWSIGVSDWSQAADAPPAVLPARLRGPLCARIVEAEAALASAELARLAAALPGREHWRLYPTFCDRAVFLDIETDAEGVTAIGLLDQRGPRVLLAGRDLDQFPAQVPADALLVTYNGGSYDIPILRRAFPDWQVPAAHIDLRPIWARLGHEGGLKSLEDAQGIGRPDHLRGMDGWGASRLWGWGQRGNREALLRFVEYNLYDTINLRTLMALGYNALVDRLAAAGGPAAAPLPVSHRGDVLYDVSKILLAL